MDTKVHHRVHKSLPMEPVLSQTNTIYILTYFFNIHINIILASVVSSLLRKYRLVMILLQFNGVSMPCVRIF